MELDGQGIERRDFPISRRGYEPAAVDAHLHAVSVAVAELRREAQKGESLGASAASQVQSILDAAEATASDIVGQAQQTARRAIETAEMEAQRTRQDAIARAQAHVAAVAEATAKLRSGVEAMDGDLAGLVERLRSGAAQLGGELAGLERDMAGLYDAAARGPAPQAMPAAASAPPPEPADAGEPDALFADAAVDLGGAALRRDGASAAAEAAAAPAPAATPAPAAQANGAVGASAAEPVRADLATMRDGSEAAQAAAPAAPSADLDGARLIALNMALNGDSREATDRYLAENFDLPERQKLIDEVYAAIDG